MRARARRHAFAPVLALAGALATLGTSGCHRGPKSPAEAYGALERAVAASDATAFYALLDDNTRWSIESTLRDQRLMRTIISAKYPEAEAQKELSRLAAAEEAEPARYFARVDEARGVVPGYRARLGGATGAVAVMPLGDDVADVTRGGGAPCRFHRNRNGSWGLAELTETWTLEKDRAVHAVKTVRENAALYQKAEEK
jgi:hypothetical protein